MAVAYLFEESGLTQQQYDQVMQEASAAGPPAGALLHMSGPTEGGWRIIDVWESQAAADAFYGSDAFRQALQRSGRPGAAQPTIWPLHAFRPGAS